ncbi:hypothetical protein MRX96_013682 [Rhipicephalus microplus]
MTQSTKAIAPRSSSYHCGCDSQVSTSADRVVAQYRGTMEEMRQPLEVVRDDQQSTEHESVFRANLADEDAVNEWIEAYGVRTNTSWIVWRVQSVGECTSHLQERAAKAVHGGKRGGL